MKNDGDNVRISLYSRKRDKLDHMFILVFVLVLAIFVFGL